MSYLTTNEKKEILSQLIINRVNENKCIIQFIGVNLDSINYEQVVANMLIDNSYINKAIIELLSPSRPFSKKVKAIQYS